MALSAYSGITTKHAPGNSSDVILVPANDIATLSIEGTAPALEVDDLTTGESGAAVAVVCDIDGVIRKQEMTGSPGGVQFIKKTIELHVSKMTTLLRAFLENTAGQSPGGIVAITKDMNGSYWVTGLDAVATDDHTTGTATRGLYVESCVFTTGTGPDDLEGDKAILTLTGIFPEYDLIVASDATVGIETTAVITEAT